MLFPAADENEDWTRLGEGVGVVELRPTNSDIEFAWPENKTNVLKGKYGLRFKQGRSR